MALNSHIFVSHRSVECWCALKLKGSGFKSQTFHLEAVYLGQVHKPLSASVFTFVKLSISDRWSEN